MELDRPVEKIWDLIGSFNAMPDWHPAVDASVLEDKGNLRKLTLEKKGGTMVERQVGRDDDGKYRHYTYKIEQGTLPVDNYEATIRVAPRQGGCTVEWYSHFDPKGVSDQKAADVIADVYSAGLTEIMKKVW